MDDWRNFILAATSARQALAREAEQARLLQDVDGSQRSIGWRVRLAALIIILLGTVAWLAR